ncbi:hypothetical protein IMZ31_23510 (plasmid) [Pontibacillus sp. ALD_SL1]|uniref:hypothetical protein n=1 Tax=Pontibacillus sp. ALD_SL1 TaxID=2777185 RepID=UPI001A962FC8|nr:hypothetical protein [Pontibacillus sp. ALD_SL1]QST02420.1 hypothetical protein IMZ31_23510 [Pontibacillus sp. ALD_SL1]
MMAHETVVKRAENEKYILKIEQDVDAESPREWDNLGTMIHWHPRYVLGDRGISKDDYEGAEEVLKGEGGNVNDLLFLPLYLYDHSGLTMNTTGFHSQWDSGQVGWIYVTKEKVREWFGVKRVTEAVREKALERLVGEVSVFDQYLRNDTYGFILEEKKEDGNEEIDSCWGFYGDNVFENGMEHHFTEEHRDLLKKLA